MKNKRLLVSALCLVFTLCLVLAACSPIIIPATLPTPVVTIDADGLASWQKVEHASGYKYKIDDGKETKTTDLSVQLEEGQTIVVKAYGNSKYYRDSAFSAAKTYGGVEPATLDVPVVHIADNGVAYWNAVANATAYQYQIDSDEAAPTTDMSVRLSDGQTISVKAVGDGNALQDSQYSDPQPYNAPEVPESPEKLPSPTITISLRGVASWNAIPGADGYYYVITEGDSSLTRSGAEPLFTRELSVQLPSVGASISVIAVGDSGERVYFDNSEPATSQYTIPEDHPHIDDDNDTLCDLCTKSILAQLSFLSINDLHGKFLDSGTQPGLDEMTTYLKNLYADDTREEILLSTGDMFQGTAESSLTKGKLMTTWMNAVSFHAMALGNHEFDWGMSAIEDVSKLAQFPILGINVTVRGVRPDYIKSSVVVEKAGVKIGIIGAIGNCLSSISGEVSDGLAFATDNALTNLVKNESDRLRQQEQCDIIVYILHDGYNQNNSNVQDFTASQFNDGKGHVYYDTSLSDGYVDLVFESHTHKNYILRDEYGVYHLQGGSENENINLADVSFNTVTKKINVTPNKIPVDTYANSNINSDPIVQEIYNQFEDYFPEYGLYTSIGTNSAKRSSKDIVNKVSELYYKIGVETWGSKVVLGGGYLKTRDPYDLAAGKVSYADIFSLLPFDNEIVLGKIKGSDLLANFYNQSTYTYYAPNLTAGDISATQDYYIVVDTYTSTYYKNHITEEARYTSGIYARDLLADFIKDENCEWGIGDAQTVSISEALEIGSRLSNGSQTSESYILTGTIESIENTKYWNLYITDGSNRIYIYGVSGVSGTLKVGDTITIFGPIKKYGSTIEVMNAGLLEYTPA